MAGSMFEDVFQDQFIPLDIRKQVGNYKIGKTLGKGSFSTVREGKHLQNEQTVAIKIIPKSSILQQEKIKKRFCSEIKVQKGLDHPNIVRCLEWMETGRNFYLVLELVEGENMKDYLKRKKQIDETEGKSIMRQICSAVHYMHNKGVLHRDLKLDNMVLEKDGKVKIADFGLSTSLEGIENKLHFCGSPSFIAPEVLSKRNYTTASDIWSLGVNLFYLLIGTLPFTMESKNNFVSLYFSILQGCEIPSTISEECRDLLTKMLTVDEDRRIAMHDILEHKWLTPEVV
ncbi:uncharacterized protein [Mytilus edulis]|uniref:uncharacterized protein n=1 Tax=Mytilus edulis TaxID=6550 RepID=UPI0039F00D51